MHRFQTFSPAGRFIFINIVNLAGQTKHAALSQPRCNRTVHKKNKPMPVFQLIYRSKANAYFTDDDLIVLLRQCRSNNIEKKVTGLLLYGYGNFIQLLEGDDDVVRDLFAERISLDPRHRDPVVLHQKYVQKRLFKNWSMAFKPLNAERVHQLSGFLEPEQVSKHGKNLLAPLRLLEVIQGFALDMRRK
jgi:hypothetical protein